jgi:hypothetical protein
VLTQASRRTVLAAAEKTKDVAEIRANAATHRSVWRSGYPALNPLRETLRRLRIHRAVGTGHPQSSARSA